MQAHQAGGHYPRHQRVRAPAAPPLRDTHLRARARRHTPPGWLSSPPAPANAPARVPRTWRAPSADSNRAHARARTRARVLPPVNDRPRARYSSLYRGSLSLYVGPTGSLHKLDEFVLMYVATSPRLAAPQRKGHVHFSGPCQC